MIFLSILLPPTHSSVREGNVFSLSVHRRGTLYHEPMGYPPNMGPDRGYPPGGGTLHWVCDWTGGTLTRYGAGKGGTPTGHRTGQGVPPTIMTSILFVGTLPPMTWWMELVLRCGRYASCGHAGGHSCIELVCRIYWCVNQPCSQKN